jgi:tetratricopeptide (TPR) repeat protein
MPRRILAVKANRLKTCSMASALWVTLSVIGPVQGAELQAGHGLTYAESLYVEALKKTGEKQELTRFWSGKLASDDLGEKETGNAVQALIELGAYAETLPYLPPIARKAGGGWLHVFADAAAKGGASDRFADFLEDELQRTDLTPAEIDERVALYYARVPERAVAALGTRAVARGGVLAAAHGDALKRLNRSRELRRFLNDLAANRRLPEQDRRAAAFRLLDLGERQQAEAAYLDLAENDPSNGPDVELLLFLWGPRPGSNTLDWIEQRYRASVSPSERGGWLKHMIDLGGGERAVALIESGGPASISSMREHYIAALAEMGDGRRLSAVIDAASEFEGDVGKLTRYAQIAEGAKQLQAADRAWKAVLAIDPDHVMALRQSGSIASADGRPKEAEQLLGRLMSIDVGDWEVNQLYAEVLTAQNRSGAADFYRRALDQLAGLPKRTERDRLAEARIQARLGDAPGVRRVFEGLLRDRPNDSGLLAQYADLLIKAGRPELAIDILDKKLNDHES